LRINKYASDDENDVGVSDDVGDYVGASDNASNE
jgi:hypothetical protein